MRFLLVAIFIAMSGAFAQKNEMDQKAQNVSKEKTVEQLKTELNSTSNLEKRFNIQSAIAAKYSSLNLTKALAADARTSAESLLVTASSFKDSWNYANAVHHAHLVIGRANLFEGKMEEAKLHLKLAAQVPGSPQLNSFGPNMTLAKELLEKGEKEAVLAYFQDCLAFWNDKSAKTLIEEWKADIAREKIPSFKGNLIY